MVMKRVACLLGVLVVGVLAAVPAAQGGRSASRTCRMNGEWVEAKDTWSFEAKVTQRDGSTELQGRYDNPGTGTADVTGTFIRGTWDIMFKYTDAGHRGVVRQLKGTSSHDGPDGITISGDYTTTVLSQPVKQNGKFKIQGTCR